MPLGDRLGVRVAVRYRNLDGWLRNTAQPIANPFYRAATGAPTGAAQLPGTSDRRPGDEELLGRVTLKGDLTPRLTARLKLFAARSTDAGPGVSTQNIGPCSGPNPRMYGIADASADCRPDNHTTQGDPPAAIASTMHGANDSGKAFGKLNAYTAALDLEWKLGDKLAVNSTTGYNYLSYKFFSGLDQTSYSQLAFVDKQRNEAFSQEVRLTSELSGAFNFMVGGYYQDTKLRDHNDVKLNDGNYNALVDRYVSYEDLGRQSGRTLSGFIQGLVKITGEIELAGGARYTNEHKTFAKHNLYGIGGFNTLTTVYPGSDTVGELQGRFRDSNISPEATLTWRPSSNRTVFVAYRTGFKSGGFGVTSPLSRSAPGSATQILIQRRPAASRLVPRNCSSTTNSV